MHPVLYSAGEAVGEDEGQEDEQSSGALNIQSDQVEDDMEPGFRADSPDKALPDKDA